MCVRRWSLLVLLPFAVPSAFAQCNLNTWAQENSPGVYTIHADAIGSCHANGKNGGGVSLYINGIRQANCPDGLCSFDVGTSVICQPYDPQISASCLDAGCNAVSQSTTLHIESDHQPQISNQPGGSFIAMANGSTSFSAAFHVRAPAAWTDRTVTYQWLPSGVVASTERITGGSDELGVSFGGAVPPGALLLKATVLACGDKAATAIASPSNYACCCQSTPTAPQCVAHPINVASGNMRMSDTDLLPSMPGLALTRTYDSKNKAVDGRFGLGWRSFLDVVGSTLTADGDTYVTIQTGDGAIYAFRNFAQIWPENGMPATLAYDGAAGTYTLHEPQHDVDVILRASDGVPLAYHSRSTGREARIGYSGSVPGSVTDSWGNWSWTLSASGNRIAAIAIDGTSNAWQYIYDASGLLTTVQGPNNAAWRTYAYSSGALTEARDAAGRLIESHTYDVGRATRSISDEGDVTAINYSESLGVMQMRVTYATGAVTSFFSEFIGGAARTTSIVGSCSGCGVNDAVYAYDTVGNMIREQDARGYVTTRSFDGQGRVLSSTVGYKPSGCDPETDAGHCRLTSAALGTASLDATPASATTTYAYGDVNWPDRPTLVTTPSVVNAGQSRTVTYTYDLTTGMVLQEQITGWKNATETETIVSSTALYDGAVPAAFNPGGNFDPAWLSLPQPAGLKRSFDGPRTDVADVTQWVYYPIAAAVPPRLRGHLAAVRDAVGNVTRFEAYDAFGDATRVVDPNGVATESTYDTAGRLLTSTLKGVAGCDTAADPLCATDLVTQRTYSPPLGPLASETRPGGGATTYEYDDRRRMTALTRSVSATAYERAEYDYDTATGKRSAERYKSGSPGSWTLARSEAFAYDTLARLREIDHPDGTKIVYTYDAANNVKTVQDERHTTANTTYAYDPLNRLASVGQTLSTAPGGSILTQHAYDVAGNLTAVVDANGNTTTYAFDDLGRLSSQVSPVTGTTSYSYDPAGNLISTTDANGATTARAYDAVGRALTAVSSCTGADTEQILWTYDDPAPGKFGLGRLASMTDPSGSTSYAYERRGLLRSEDRMIGDWSSTSEYAYDVDANRTQAGSLHYTYDLLGRPMSVIRRECTGCTEQPIITSASYLPFGPEKSLAFGNATQQTKSFDTRYRITENKLTGPGAVTVADYAYGSDNLGNITSIHDVVNASFDRIFGYDDLNRLITANSGAALWGNGSYAYDSIGNTLSATLGEWSGTFTYVATTSRIATVTQQDFNSGVNYDEAGNELNGRYSGSMGLVGHPTSTLTREYSCRNLMNRITSSTPPGPCRPGHCQPSSVQFTYAYDGRGVRVHVDGTDGQHRDYVYTPELQLHLMHDDADVMEMAWFNGHAVAQISQSSSAIRYTFTDHLGTPLLQTDATAQIVWQGEYDPFGRLSQLRAGDSEVEQPLRLPGQEIAAHSGISTDDHYNIFRWYRAGWGRYTQPDPLEPGGLGFFSDSDLLAFPTLPVRSQRRTITEQRPLPYSRVEPPYTYAASNPLSFSDPNGLAVIPCIGGGTGRIPDFINPKTKKPRRTPGGKLIGECKILLACADPPLIRIYTTTITHVQPCPPCPGPLDCLAFVDTATGQPVGPVACKK